VVEPLSPVENKKTIQKVCKKNNGCQCKRSDTLDNEQLCQKQESKVTISVCPVCGRDKPHDELCDRWKADNFKLVHD